MKSTERFTDRVENYTKHRPSYPEQLIEYLIEYAGLTTTSKIADIGAGTGIFSKMLLEKALEVYAVEPNDEMRNASIQLLSKYSNYYPVNGTAERTSLQSGAMDLLTAAQSFHWFDREQTVKEFRRILKPDGHVALVWNERYLEDAFQIGYDQILRNHIEAYDTLNHRNMSDEMIQGFFLNSEVHKVSYDNSQLLDLPGLKGRLLSSSYVPVEGQKHHERIMDEMDQLFKTYEKDGQIKFNYITNAYIGIV